MSYFLWITGIILALAWFSRKKVKLGAVVATVAIVWLARRHPPGDASAVRRDAG